MKEPCNHELKPHCEFPTCNHCGEIWYDMIAYDRAIERERQAKELAAKQISEATTN